jgi:twitching motility protein PilT
MEFRARPSITATELRSALIDRGLVTDAQLVSLLGTDRHAVALDHLETALVTKGVISADDLLEIKCEIADMPPLAPDAAPLSVLAQDVARECGAIAVAGPTPTVAIVEDLQGNIDRIEAALRPHTITFVLTTMPTLAEMYKVAYGRDGVSRHPAATSLEQLFDLLVSQNGSDLHLKTGMSPSMRVNNQIRRLPFQPLTETWIREQFAKILPPGKMDRVDEHHDADGSYAFGDTRFRINLGRDNDGITAAVRRLPSRIFTMDELDLPWAVRKFPHLERGIVLITGPTGSGKTTTLATLLAEIAMQQSRHIITLEDPIEILLPSRGSLVNQRELGQSFSSFALGIRQSLRQDPDVILIGEARDKETMAAMISAAEAGALVFATLHTYDAAQTLSRLIGAFPGDEQDQVRSTLSHVLRGIVSQTLVETVAGGRLAAFEVLVGTPAVLANLRDPKGLTQVRQVMATSRKDGMQLLEYDLARLVKRNLVARDVAAFKARNVEDFNNYVTSADVEFA